MVKKPSKKAKKGYTEVDLIPMIHSLQLTQTGETVLELRAVLSAQNPGLNPELVISTARANSPVFQPDFVEFERLDFLNDSFAVMH